LQPVRKTETCTIQLSLLVANLLSSSPNNSESDDDDDPAHKLCT